MIKLKLIRGAGMLLAALLAINEASIADAESIVLDGLIEPYLIVKIGSPTAGILETVKVDRGDMVTAGQVLATLQSGVEKATMELARARAGMESAIKARESKLNYMVREQKRMEQLHDQALVSFEALDESRTNSSLARLDLEEAKENQQLAEFELKRSTEVVNRMTIYSPITGVVTNRFLTAGEYVENQPILQLAQINPLNVEVFAPVSLLGAIKVGMIADVAPEKPVGGVYRARVTIVDRVMDAASGTFGVRLDLPNPREKLPAGLKCKVTFRAM